MIKRKCIQSLIDWSGSDRRTVAVVTGPRCVGKTTLVRELGESYGCFIELNMKHCYESRKILSDCTDSAELSRRLARLSEN